MFISFCTVSVFQLEIEPIFEKYGTTSRASNSFLDYRLFLMRSLYSFRQFHSATDFFLEVDCTFFTQVNFRSTVEQIIKSTFGLHSGVQECQIVNRSQCTAT